jgi:hypothetical protein
MPQGHEEPMRALVLLACVLVLAAPAVLADGPRIDMAVHADAHPLGTETRIVRVTFNFTCGVPPDPETHVELDVPSGNTFNLTFHPAKWVYTASDCARAQGVIRGASDGTFRFTRALPPFSSWEYPINLWLGPGRNGVIWANDVEPLVVVADQQLNLGARMTVDSTRRDDGHRATVTWLARNHGTGAFKADVEVDGDTPEWIRATRMPASIESDSEGRANFQVDVHMPDPCPSSTAVLTLKLTGKGADARSRAQQEVRVQGVIPCGSTGTPAAPIALVALAVLAAGLARKR